MTNDHEARHRFKLAAINALIDAGITTPEAMTEALTKQANGGGIGVGGLGMIEGIKGLAELGVGAGEHLVNGAASVIGNVGLPTLLAGPAVLGAGAGYLAGKGRNSADVVDPETVNQQDLIDEYHRGTDKLKRDTTLRNIYGNI